MQLRSSQRPRSNDPARPATRAARCGWLIVVCDAPPARPGMALTEIDTPALLIDLDAYERNIIRMQSFADRAGLALRPHAKTHKCAVIARQQMAMGAVGVCCQKVSEAEALAFAGVSDIFVSNEIVGAAKLARLAALARLVRIRVCVDDAANVDDLARAAQRQGVEIDVLVEMDVGAGRCGVLTVDEVESLARRIETRPALRFKGIQAYHGAAQHVRDYHQRSNAVDNAAARASSAKDHLHRQGIECDVITGAGTGTYPFEAQSGVFTELQCGSYVFMDADYGRNLNRSGEPFSDYANSLFVLTTVMSKNRPGLAVVDAGLKAVSVDSGLPLVHGHHQIQYVAASDEHGQLDTSGAEDAVDIGSSLTLIPGHCDPTVNLYDWFVAYRGLRVVELWPIVARGAVR